MLLARQWFVLSLTKVNCINYKPTCIILLVVIILCQYQHISIYTVRMAYGIKRLELG